RFRAGVHDRSSAEGPAADSGSGTRLQDRPTGGEPGASTVHVGASRGTREGWNAGVVHGAAGAGRREMNLASSMPMMMPMPMSMLMIEIETKSVEGFVGGEDGSKAAAAHAFLGGDDRISPRGGGEGEMAVGVRPSGVSSSADGALVAGVAEKL